MAILKPTRIKLLLSLNAVAVLVAGVLIANAITGDGTPGRIVNEKSDDISTELSNPDLIDADHISQEAPSTPTTNVSVGQPINFGRGGAPERPTDSGTPDSNKFWAVREITITAAGEFDICINSKVTPPSPDQLYWQSDNPSVISGFFPAGARSNLGFAASHCRFPNIVGLGRATITVGSYDGRWRDTLVVNVVPVPIEDWKREVLRLVNVERVNAGLSGLSWGDTCAGAADIRAREIAVQYSHTRPDGSSWATACPIPTSTGGDHGENIFVGAAATSPYLVVAGFMASPTHKANILNPSYTRLSVGLYFDLGTAQKIHWSQLFATY